MSSCTSIIPYTPPVTPDEDAREARASSATSERLISRISESSLSYSRSDGAEGVSSCSTKSLDSTTFKFTSPGERDSSRWNFSEEMGFRKMPSREMTSEEMAFSETESPGRGINPYRESILDSPKYGILMKDSDVLFHGIDTAIWKIPSILELGILNKKTASSKGVTLGFNFGSQHRLGIENGYNKEAGVSCAYSPVHINASGVGGAFGVYIKNGISFALRDIPFLLHHSLIKPPSGIPSEIMIDCAIPAKFIVGLVVSTSLLNIKITEINFLKGGVLLTFHLRCQSLLEYLEGKIDIEPSLAAAIAVPVNSVKDRESLEILFNELILKYFSSRIDIESACLLDLLKLLVPSDLSIYDTNGFKIS